MEICSRSLEKNAIQRDHVSIEIVNEDSLVSSIKSKMDHLSLSHCISRVAEEISKGFEEKYYPSLVSIGPFHRDRDTLKVMEDCKWRYFNTLLSRKQNAELFVDSCVRTLRHVEQKARKFYGEEINMGSDHFVEMMLLDGCFIIELFLENAFKNLRRRDDPFFIAYNNLFKLKCDLILFENQLPFFVLEHLFHLVPIPKQCNFSLIELSLLFFKNLIPKEYPHFPPKNFAPQTHHLLDLIRQHYLPTSHETLSPSGEGQMHIHNATHLSTLGIKVGNALDHTPLNVSFYKGELYIPPLKIHGYTETLFRNLIAMEICDPRCSKHVTSYAILMDRLIRSKRDVRLLHKQEILIGGHDKEGEIVMLFKKLYVDINLKEFYYRGLCEQVNVYPESRKQGWGQSIRHIYHRTHLGAAGFSLAVLLLVLFFSGVLFSVISFLLHHFQ
ncbi:hypothetical protein BUALT_Bualt14G0125300 [Buddleja alternifolia]|uniref:Uncharacterized protein n=1 Tax=Buddleja alternifolia TaxID=168488 RepID=A0AAV6WRQ9_9LAMI|nr:hypothetical protein BUALT_Bualt14G0125300 [Buddleja alternifolia]